MNTPILSDIKVLDNLLALNLNVKYIDFIVAQKA